MGQVTARKRGLREDRIERSEGVPVPAWVPKRCKRCAAVYATREAWQELPFIGTMNFGFTHLEYRNCPCQNTLTIEVGS